ncbi:biotin-dependent carboxyltransferase family protein [Nisaea acidiphila]|uniref:Biotin-dependent carboxyltransferase family protein n=1 Tax=Nisaea acidiphila TaxID=1862145 RepID=A0A9J7AU37_9PROT|nr:biotin-dependent carboxyltransferase family protein [Nisaea acidiphila]UUX50001.1 biotin-dependent carboxyltransferase family protein [Nisaea acidiphila]
MSSLKVIQAGFAPTLQDFGRPAFQNRGVPVSGALDPVSLRIGNALVGNDGGVAAVEFRLVGPTLEVLAESVRVALTGTRSELIVEAGERVVLPSYQSVTLRRGQRLSVAPVADSGVAYLCVEGGFDLPRVFDSLSTYGRSRIGGFEGRALQEGDELPLRLAEVEARGELRLEDLSYLEERGPMRVVFGPQRDYFTDESAAAFLTSEYTISREADRMGMRLEGPALEHARGYNITSDGIVTGAIQVPGNGLPIILLADHQTTGGYPKIGTVISADIPRLGRMKPGDTLLFEEIDVAGAEEARRAQEKEVLKLLGALSPAAAWLDEAALYRENLISGVVQDGEIG